ncbi:MAG TPA: discoidin domain-containing protein, partial [Polyangiaceae bacterium]|nr:discoidin domain-containing protein [Polyangiaceae bacterium]
WIQPGGILSSHGLGTDYAPGFPYFGDADKDGILNPNEPPGDTDHDGIIDALDPDADNDEKPDGTDDTVALPMTGNYQRWNNVPGTAVSAIPLVTNPDVVLTLPTLEAPTNVGDNFGARIVGLIRPAVTGNYTFFISGDDNVSLLLSPDDKPTGKTQIAYHTGFTGVREWTKFPTQRSAPIALQANKLYYIEAQQKEGAGSDHMAVGWLKPGDTGTVPSEIPAIDPTPPVDEPAGTGYLVYEKWTNVQGSAVNQIPVQLPPNSTQNVTKLEAPSDVGENYGMRMRGWVTPPATGVYRFWISGDDNVALYFSQSGGPENKQRIAYHDSYTGQYEWNKFSTQHSADLNLVGGHRYYIEALMKESSGRDYVAVGWLTPGHTGSVPNEIVPGRQLSPFLPSDDVAACGSQALPRVAATASSQESSSLSAAKAIDGNMTTRWSSQFSNPQWLSVDLGEVQFINRVKITWQNSASADYDIQVSNDNNTWTTVFTDAHADGGTDDITGLAATGRYVRMYSRARKTQYGNSLFEMEVFGDANESCRRVLGESFHGEAGEQDSSCSVVPGHRSGAAWLYYLAAAACCVQLGRRRRRRKSLAA